jgi:hypothetical protein
MDDEGIRLSGGSRTTVVRQGDVVLRPVAPWTATIHALLRHLEAVGFTGAPRMVGDGYDHQGNEVVRYIEGQLVHPGAWSDDGVSRVGELLRELHDATSTFVPPEQAAWQPCYFRSTAPDAIIGHCDTGPWNIVAKEGIPVALVDWEYAGPTSRWDDIAQAAWLNAQLHDDDVAERNGLPSADARARQLRYFLEGYRMPKPDRRGFVGRMIEYAIRDSAKEASEAGVTRDSSDIAPLWAVAWRARSAAWMIRNRSLLQGEIER